MRSRVSHIPLFLRPKLSNRMDLFSFLSPFVFCSFSSGSSGNCYYVGKQDEGVLVDAGINSKHIVNGLRKIDLTPDKIKAIFVTHDHIDHVRGLDVFANTHNIPIYGHADCLQGIAEGRLTKNVNTNLFHEIEPLQTITISEIEVTPFPVMHDGRGAVGYHLSHDGHKLTIATDIGMLDNMVKEYLCKAENIVIESNYDPVMLENGPYPYILQQRIKGPFGHLSNQEASRFVAENYRPELKNIMLCHLSENNNTPEVAMQCLYKQFRYKHIHPETSTSIFPLPRHKSTGLVYL